MTKISNLNGNVVRGLRSGIALGSLTIGLAVGIVPATAQNATQDSSPALLPGTNPQAPNAQTAPDTQAAQTARDTADIVVTGSLIRGKAPTGGELVTITNQDIAALGVADTSQLLGSLPQDANFNSRPQVGAFAQYQSINTPVLRYLGGASSGSNSTLLLIDGVRMPGMGVLQTSPDIDAIAPGALLRIDVATDGGSATYGSDAVGGVVNLITRTRYDGLEVNGHFGGAAGGYRQYDASVTSGKTWNSGSVWFSYQYAHHDLLLQSQRPYDKHLADYATGVPFDQTCATPNFSSITFPYPAPYNTIPVAGPPSAVINGVPTSNPGARCDLSRLSTLLPAETRHSLMGGFDQALTDKLTFDVKAYYVHRNASNDGGPYSYSSLPATYAPTGTSGFAEGTLNDPIFQHSITHTQLDAFAVIPKLTWKFGRDWQNVTFFNYGQGIASFTGSGPAVDSGTLGADAAAGNFNPFTGLFANTAAGQQALAYQANFGSYSRSKDAITNARTVFDGPLFALSGGEVRAAAGAEIFHEVYSLINGSAENSAFAMLANNFARRTVKSVFGELSVPVIGEANRSAGLYSLTLSAAGRYDHYSDFGGTFNPKLGAKFQPASWLTLRGDWSKSFQAPSLSSTSAAIPVSAAFFPAGSFGPTPTKPGSNQVVLLLFPGGGVNLQPQKATTWEIGFDIKPAAGLSASMTYYHIDFSNRIGTAQFYSSNFYQLYPNSFVLAPTNGFTTAQIKSYLGNASNQNLIGQYINNPSSVYALENGLTQNLSATNTSGLDFNVNYTQPTSFGSVFGSVAGTYVLTFNSQATPTSPFAGLDANNVQRLRLQTTLGLKTDTIQAQVNWRLTGKYAVPGNAFQSEVGSFSTVNLSLAYSPKLTGPLQDTTISLNVDNLLDTNPPFYAGGGGNGFGYADFTIGRYIQLGINKKF